MYVWAFDPLGDQTKQTQHSLTGGKDTVTSYTYNGNGTAQPNTLTTASTTGPSGPSSASYAYDPAGNTTTRTLPAGKQTLTWTHDGKLASATTPAGTTSYIYDADGSGLLLQKTPAKPPCTCSAAPSRSSSTPPPAPSPAPGSPPLPGGGTAVRTGTGTGTNYSFELADQHGTGLLTLDNTAANPAWRQFTPYGAPRGQAPPSWPDPNGFLGKPADPATGLTTLGARQYDPATGRFLSLDPVFNAAAPQTMAGYTYAAGNPATNADPTGLYLTGSGSGCGYATNCGGSSSGGGSGGSSGAGGGAGGGTFSGYGCGRFAAASCTRPGPTIPPPISRERIRRRPVLGGLLNEYERAA